MGAQRISYVPVEQMDREMRAEMERCQREGTLRPESSNSQLYDDRQKAALAYAEAIAWHLDTDDAFWARLRSHFSEPELVELGCVIGLTLGQQSWLRLLNIEHHEVLAGTAASMAPGFEDAVALKAAKGAAGYWTRKR